MSTVDRIFSINYKTHLIISLAARLLLIAYGIYHDSISRVQYTDVDYKVFTDAAKQVLAGGSPYDRHTYRYSPLIAYLVIPNLLLHNSLGKILFSIIDVIVAILIKLLVRKCHLDFWKNPVEAEKSSNLSMILWLYNPLTIAISTRGNCDSIAVFFVLATLYSIQCKKSYFVSGLIHGIAIHFRLYPIIYSVAYYMHLSKFSFYSGDFPKRKSATSEKRSIFQTKYLLYLLPNSNQIQLVFGCTVSLISLTALFYYLYGYKFLFETYLYHFSRNDTRHNFSLYFYLLYLTAWIKNIGLWQRILISLPQLILLVVLSFHYGLNRFSLNFAILTLTIVFVTYNTVLTSQYFVWILALLPLCLWQVKMPKKSVLFLLVIWFAGQGAWLLPAYFLEFHGYNTFFFIWIQSVSFFCANIAILARLIVHFAPANKNE